MCEGFCQIPAFDIPPMTFGSDFQQSLKGRNFAWGCFSGVGSEAEKNKKRDSEAKRSF